VSTALQTSTALWQLLARAALVTVTALAPLMVLVLFARRLAGGLEPLPSGLLVMVGVSSACLMAAWRFAWQRFASSEAGRRLATWWPPALLAVLALSLSVPGTPPLALVVFWLLLAGEEIAAGMSRRAAATPRRTEAAVLPQESELPADVSQQITRTIHYGVETLIVLLRVSFAAGQQTETVHVAFCPPLVGVATAKYERLRGVECEVKITSVETYGARLEAKRRGALQAADEAVLKLTVTAGDESVLSTEY
jgi:hypothetical protein